MAKGKRAVPEAFRRVIERRRSGAAGSHVGRTVPRGVAKRAAVRTSQES
jgi:hypothetical protein